MMLHPSRILVLLILLATSGVASAATRREVVVYISVDDIFARPIAEQFTKSTGIEVKLVPDTKETKGTGLVNRLIAERGRPQADVFWSGDPVRAAILKLEGISFAYRSLNAEGLPAGYNDPDGYWVGFSARTRVILYNTTAVHKPPSSIFDLATDADLSGKACIANPLFGTTSAQAAALFVVLGDKGGRNYFEGLSRNRIRMLSSNGEVGRRVSEADCAIGIVDSDDAYEAIKHKKPVGVVYPDEKGIGTLLIPNAAVLIANGPDSAAGKKFIDYLLRPEVEQALAEGDAAQIPLRPNIKRPPHVPAVDKLTLMKVDYGRLAVEFNELSRGFLREWTARNHP